MAQKKITELQLRDAVTSDLSFPSDDGIQSYRVTAAQMKAFVLANQNILLAMLKDDIFHGLTGVSAADDDYFPLIDTSDSNKTKKALVSTFARNLYRTVNDPSNEAILSTDGTIKITGTTGNVILPTAVGIAGKRYKFIHAGSQLVEYTINTTSSQTIGGVADGSYKLFTTGEVLEVESDGANWLIMGRKTETDWSSPSTITVSTTGGGTPTKGTIVVDAIRWRRSGRNADVFMQYKHSGGSPAAGTAGAYKYAMPTGLSIDTTIVNADATVGVGANNLGNSVGVGHVGGATNAASAGVCVFDADYFTLHIVNTTSGGAHSTSLYAWSTSTMYSHARFTVPISGWQP